MGSVSPEENQDQERIIALELLRLLNEQMDLRSFIQQVLSRIQDYLGCEAAGVRLREGNDFPYFTTHGFPAEFVSMENSLCARDLSGQLLCDEIGNPLLECMCGNILCGRFDPQLPFFTPAGSFWCNNTTRLLATTTEAERQTKTRNRCNGEGYESVALIPLRTNEQTFGLLQLNDRRPDIFTREKIKFIESLASIVAMGLAIKQLNERIAGREQFLRLVIDNDPNCIFVKDLNGRYLLANRALAELYQVDVRHLEGHTDLEMTVDIPSLRLDTEIYRQDDREVIETRQIKRTPTEPFTGKNGETRWLSTVKIPLEFDQHGDCVLGVAVDVTDTQKILAAKEESERRYQTIFENAADAIYIVSRTGHILDANRLACERLGYTRQEMMSLTLAQIDTPEFHQNVPAHMQELEQTGATFFETVHRAKDGRLFSIELSARYIDYYGEIAILSIARDITERKNREQSLRLAHEELEKRVEERTRELYQTNLQLLREIDKQKRIERSLRFREDHFKRTFDQSPIGAAIVSLEFRFVRVNEEFCRITGYQEIELLSMGFPEITHPDDLEQDVLYCRQLVAGEIDHYQMEKRYIAKDGNVVWVRLSVRLMRDAQGDPLYFLPMVQDIDNRKQMEKELDEKQRSLIENNYLLEQKNTALHELMQQVKDEKERTEKQIRQHLEQFVFPLIKRLKTEDRLPNTPTLELLEENLHNLAKTLPQDKQDQLRSLSRREIEICNMIRGGLSTKEIADILNISPRSVDTHRNKIRKKLGLTGKTINLESYLTHI